MTMNAGGAVDIDMIVEQGVDWPGITVPILDKLGAPFDPSGCSAHGEIRVRRSDDALFIWSSTPAAGQGTITLSPAGVSWSLLAVHSLLWSFTDARYEIKIHNPAGPVGDRDIRVAQGAVSLDLQLDPTALP